MYHGLHCVDDSTWPINSWTNRCVRLLRDASPCDLLIFLTVAEIMLFPLHHNGTYWYECCRPSDLQDHWAGGTSAQQKYFCFSKKISWSSISHEVCSQYPISFGHFENGPQWRPLAPGPPFWHCFTKWPSVYTSIPTQGM